MTKPHEFGSIPTNPPTHGFAQRFVAGLLVVAALPALAFALSVPDITTAFVAGLLTAFVGAKLRKRTTGARWNRPVGPLRRPEPGDRYGR